MIEFSNSNLFSSLVKITFPLRLSNAKALDMHITVGDFRQISKWKKIYYMLLAKTKNLMRLIFLTQLHGVTGKKYHSHTNIIRKP